MTLSTQRVSYHDPDGSVYLIGGEVFRALHPASATRIDEFLNSKLASDLLERGDVPATAKLMTPDLKMRELADSDMVWYRHERIPFVSYPHEWIPEQFASACAFTLRLALELREAGWDFKDGNARNVLFDGLRPVFVDFGSFEKREDTSPVWRPAGPIQRHFLLPLLVFQLLGIAPSLLLFGRPDGLSHNEAFHCLRHSRWTNMQVFWLCTLPVLLSRWLKPTSEMMSKKLDPNTCRLAVDRTIRSLIERSAALQRLWSKPHSDWSSYEVSRFHYNSEQLQHKREVIAQMLARIRPKDVLDVGTNGGEFANLAARSGSRVVSIDMDIDALRVAHASAVKEDLRVLHLHVNLTSSSPALGWNGAECLSFDDRAKGSFDLVFALAVLHHILVSGGIPLDEALKKLAGYTRSHLIIEYVDPSDVMFASMARERLRDFSWLTSELFECALSHHFDIVDKVGVIPGHRALYHCELRRA